MNEYTSEMINHTFDTNEMDLVLVTVHKVFLFTLSSYTMESRYKRYITYGIRAKIKTLGPDGLIDMHVCCQLCDVVMGYYNARYKGKYC